MQALPLDFTGPFRDKERKSFEVEVGAPFRARNVWNPIMLGHCLSKPTTFEPLDLETTFCRNLGIVNPYGLGMLA